MTFDEIREIALSFPEVEEYLVFGAPSLRVHKRFLASTAKIDPTSTLCLKVPNKLERDYLLQTKPDIFYSTPHYENFASILVRMPIIDPQEFRELFENTWLSVAPKKLVKAYHENNG